MKRFTVAVVAISGCIIGPACQAIVGIEDRVEAPSGDDASAGVESGTLDTGSTTNTPDAQPDVVEEPIPSKGCPKDCLPVAPAGWKGPSAFYDGPAATKPTSCPTGYTEMEAEAHQGMTAAAASCDCGAFKITGRRCTATFLTYTNAGCTAGEMALAKLSGCSTNGDLDIGVHYKLSVPVATNGTCSYPNAKTTAPAPAYAKVNVTCSFKTPTVCSPERSDCVATPPPSDAAFGRLCIFKEGPAQCASEDYPAKFTAYKNVSDTRSCTACAGTANAATCGSQYGFRGSELDCPNAPAPTTHNTNACYTWGGGGKVIDTLGFQPLSGTCALNAPSTPTGTATSIDEVTYCCNF